jgi:hypothetical protein
MGVGFGQPRIYRASRARVMSGPRAWEEAQARRSWGTRGKWGGFLRSFFSGDKQRGVMEIRRPLCPICPAHAGRKVVPLSGAQRAVIGKPSGLVD